MQLSTLIMNPLINHYPTNFYAFSPQADRIEPKPPNLYQLPSIDNLSDHTLSLSLAIRDARAKEKSGKMLLVLDTLSDVILRHKALTTRRWLTDFVGKRKAEGFTIVATLNPLAISKEEVQTVVDFFDGIIEIYERPLAEKAGRFLVVKKLYGRLSLISCDSGLTSVITSSPKNTHCLHTNYS